MHLLLQAFHTMSVATAEMTWHLSIIFNANGISGGCWWSNFLLYMARKVGPDRWQVHFSERLNWAVFLSMKHRILCLIKTYSIMWWVRTHPNPNFVARCCHPTKMALSDLFSSLKSTIYADSEEKESEEKGQESPVEEEEEEEPEDVRLNFCILVHWIDIDNVLTSSIQPSVMNAKRQNAWSLLSILTTVRRRFIRARVLRARTALKNCRSFQIQFLIFGTNKVSGVCTRSVS